MLTHSNYLDGESGEEPFKSYRSGLRNALSKLCPTTEMSSVNDLGCTMAVRFLMMRIATKEVWSQYCFRGNSKVKNSFILDLPKLVNILRSVIVAKRNTNEKQLDSFISTVLRKVTDRAAFKRKRGADESSNSASQSTSRKSNGGEGDSYSSEVSSGDEESG